MWVFRVIHDMIGFICDVSALPDATDQLARPVEVRRRNAVHALSLVVHDKDVRASIEEQSHDVLPPPRGREEYGTLAVIVTARRDDVDGRTPYPRVEMDVGYNMHPVQHAMCNADLPSWAGVRSRRSAGMIVRRRRRRRGR